MSKTSFTSSGGIVKVFCGAVLLVTTFLSSAHAESAGLSVHAASGDFIKIRRGSGDVESYAFASKRHRTTAAQSQPFGVETLQKVRHVIQEQQQVADVSRVNVAKQTPVKVVKVLSPFRRQGAEKPQALAASSDVSDVKVSSGKFKPIVKPIALRKDDRGQAVKRIAINTKDEIATVEGDVDTSFYASVSQPNKDQKKFIAIMREKGLVKKVAGTGSTQKVAMQDNVDARFLRLNDSAFSLVGRENGRKSLEIKFNPLHVDKRATQYGSDYATVWPVQMSDRQYVSSVFGRRVNPVTGRYSFHEGIDIAAPKGTEVLAVMDGVVSLTQNHRSLGRYVRIEHPDGSYSLYGHLSRWRVEDGQVVRAGQVIGNVGSTGRSTGSHVHFAYHVNDKPVDPLKYLHVPTEIAERTSEKTVAMR